MGYSLGRGDTDDSVMSLQVEVTTAAVFVAVGGDLNMITVRDLGAKIAEMDASAPLVLDLRRTEFIDSGALGLIGALFKAKRARGLPFLVAVAGGTQPARVLAVTNVNATVPVVMLDVEADLAAAAIREAGWDTGDTKDAG